MVDEVAVAAQLNKLWPEWEENRVLSEEWQAWSLGRQPLPAIPNRATHEYRALQQVAVTPWLGLVVQSFCQSLDCEGYTRSDGNTELWAAWQANRMDSKQVPLYEGAVTTGISYNAVLKSSDRYPEWRPYSSAKMTGFYDYPDDEFPKWAVAAEPVPTWQRQSSDELWRVLLYDDTHVHHLTRTSTTSTYVSSKPHGFKRAPVVKYVNRMTLEGRALGEVEPYTPAAARIDQDVMDRLTVQRDAAWRVRTATGLEFPTPPEGLSDEEREQWEADQVLKLSASDLLTSDSDTTKFGSLPATDITGHLRAPMDSIRMLAAVSQTPPQLLTGDINNVSAEALAAIEASFNRKVAQRKQSFGESHEQAFNLTAQLMGLDPDPGGQVRWKDMESRSMSQTADAWGKIATMLGVPDELLWEKSGFFTDQDIERARELRDRDSIASQFLFGQFAPDGADAAVG